MNILEDFEMGLLDAPMVRRSDVHKQPPPATLTTGKKNIELGHQGDFYQTGDMLDPTIVSNATVSPPPTATVAAGTVALLALFLLAYKRVYFPRRHPHADDTSLLPTTSS